MAELVSSEAVLRHKRCPDGESAHCYRGYGLCSERIGVFNAPCPAKFSRTPCSADEQARSGLVEGNRHSKRVRG